MSLMSKAMGVLAGAKAAAESVASDVSGVVKKAVEAGKAPPPPAPPGPQTRSNSSHGFPSSRPLVTFGYGDPNCSAARTGIHRQRAVAFIRTPRLGHV